MSGSARNRKQDSKLRSHVKKVHGWLLATKPAKAISAGLLFGAGVVALVFGGAVFFDYTMGSTQRMNGVIATLVPAVVALLVASAAKSTSKKVRHVTEEDEQAGKDNSQAHRASLETLGNLQDRAALVIILAGVAGILNAALNAGCGDDDRVYMSTVAWSVALGMAGLAAVGTLVAEVGEMLLTRVLCAHRTRAAGHTGANRVSLLIVGVATTLLIGAFLAITDTIAPVSDSNTWLGSTWGITGAAGLAWVYVAVSRGKATYASTSREEDAAADQQSGGQLPSTLRNASRFLFLGCLTGAVLITGMTTHTAAITPVVLPVLAVFVAVESGVRIAARSIVRFFAKVEAVAFSDAAEELGWTMQSPLLMWVSLLALSVFVVGLMALASLFGWITLEASTWIWLPFALAGLAAVALFEVGAIVRALRSSEDKGKGLPRGVAEVTVNACMVIVFSMAAFAGFITSRTHSDTKALNANLQGHLVLLSFCAACFWGLACSAFDGGLSLLQAKIAVAASKAPTSSSSDDDEDDEEY